MITASHNPPEYNGVKIIEADGTEMGDEETIKLEEIIFTKPTRVASWNVVGQENLLRILLKSIFHQSQITSQKIQERG